KDIEKALLNSAIRRKFKTDIKFVKDHLSYVTRLHLKEVLAKYDLNNGVTSIPQFKPDIHQFDDDDEEFLHCVKDIKNRLSNMGTVVDSNEAMRCEYISAILHASIRIVRRITEKGLTITPQFEIVGEESTGRVDYAIKKIIDKVIEDIICVTEGKQYQVSIGYAQNLMQCKSSYQTNERKRKADEAFGDSYYDYIYGIVSTGTDWHFILYSTEGIFCTSETEYHISLTKAVLDNDTDLRKGVKRVMEVIVGLLKDRVMIDSTPDVKRRRVEEIKK
ncbi:8651_t:CDS:2, partial [Ambispora leptoticha]